MKVIHHINGDYRDNTPSNLRVAEMPFSEFETLLERHTAAHHGGPLSTCTICFPELRPTSTPDNPLSAKVFTGKDPIAPDRMMPVLTYLYLANGLGHLTEENIKVINWLAEREISRRLFPIPS